MYDPYGYESYGYDDYYNYDEYAGYDYGYGDMSYGMTAPRPMGFGRGRGMAAAGVCNIAIPYCWTELLMCLLNFSVLYSSISSLSWAGLVSIHWRL